MKFKRVFLFFFSIILGIVAFILIFKKVGVGKVMQALALFTWWHFLLIILVGVLVIFFFLKKWKVIAQPFQYKTSWRKLLVAFLGGQVISFVTPIMFVGGEGIKAMLLKEDDEQKSFVRTFGLIIIDRLAEGCAILILFFLGGLTLFFYKFFLLGAIMVFISLLVLIVVFLGLKATPFFLFLIKIFGFKKAFKDEEKAKEEINIIEDFLKFHRKLFVFDIIFSLIILILSIVQIYLILLFLGKAPSIFEVYSIRVATLIAGLVPTPASIGGFEGSIALIFSLLKMPVQTGLALALIMRGLQLIEVGFGIFVVFPYLASTIFPTIFKNKKTE